MFERSKVLFSVFSVFCLIFSISAHGISVNKFVSVPVKGWGAVPAAIAAGAVAEGTVVGIAGGSAVKGAVVGLVSSAISVALLKGAQTHVNNTPAKVCAIAAGPLLLGLLFGRNWEEKLVNTGLLCVSSLTAVATLNYFNA